MTDKLSREELIKQFDRILSKAGILTLIPTDGKLKLAVEQIKSLLISVSEEKEG